MECAEWDGACFLFGLKGAATDTQHKSGSVDLHSLTVNICAMETVYLLDTYADVFILFYLNLYHHILFSFHFSFSFCLFFFLLFLLLFLFLFCALCFLLPALCFVLWE